MTDVIEPEVEARTADPALLEQAVTAWLSRFAAACAASDADAFADLLTEDAWWRDLLALTWDLRTFHGSDKITDLVRAGATAAIVDVTLDSRWAPAFNEAAGWLEAFYRFNTPAGPGVGVLRLVEKAPGDWKAWTVLTALDELDAHPRALGARRPTGHAPYGPDVDENWLEARQRLTAFRDQEPEVVILGAGQGGLALAASLGHLGVRTLVVEKNKRVGDSWRNRYRSLVLHDPVWADHLPYLPFPANWPIYTPKDKLGDWFEAYVSAMELNVWTDSTVGDASYDEATSRWTLTIDHAGETRTTHASHLVLATGALGEPNVPHFDSVDSFSGSAIHSSEYQSGAHYRGKTAVVIGASNSAHDIARDLYESGAQVTMVQRSSTYVMSQENGIPILFGALYREDGPPLEQADLLNASISPALNIELSVGYTPLITAADAELLDGLREAGFALDFGDAGGGLMEKALHRGGGYYIDVGASQLIVDRKIAVAQGAGVSRFVPDGVELEGGRVLPADVVVIATGYQNMRETARRIFGDKIADRCGLVWDLDDEGEMNTIWRKSGHPGFWFMGGPLASARIYSKYLALQIKAALLDVTGVGE